VAKGGGNGYEKMNSDGTCGELGDFGATEPATRNKALFNATYRKHLSDNDLCGDYYFGEKPIFQNYGASGGAADKSRKEGGMWTNEIGMCSGPGFEHFDKANDRFTDFPGIHDAAAAVYTARRKYCRFNCAQCTSTTFKTGAECTNMIVRMAPSLADPDVTGIHSRVFKQLLGKAAFEADVKDISVLNMGSRVVQNVYQEDKYLDLFPVKSLISSTEATVTVYEVHQLCIVWILATITCSFLIAVELTHAYSTEGIDSVYNQVVTGFTYSLVPSTADVKDNVTCGAAEMAYTCLRCVIELGVMVAESALPTTQVFCSWLAVDVAVIGGSRVFEVLLPRISTLGLMGILFNAVRLAPVGTRALLAMVAYIGAVSISIVLVVDASVQDGKDLTLLYFLLPSIAALVVLVVCSVLEVLLADQYNQVYLKNLGLRVEAESKWQHLCTKLLPPYWVQVVQILEGSNSAQYAQVSMRLMELAPVSPDKNVHPDDAAVIRLDPPTQHEMDDLDPDATYPERCAYYVNKELAAEAAASAENSIDFVDIMSCIRRIPNTEVGKEKSEMNARDLIIDLLDILG